MLRFALLILFGASLLGPLSAAVDSIRLSEGNRHFVRASGEPFFWLGDTAWELFHRLSEDEATHYLENRAAKGFTVIQCVLLAELHGLTVPNAEGELPLFDLDPTRPNDAYFDFVDRVVAKGNELGLTMALLPTWGDKFHLKWGVGPEVFTPENARTYGRWVAERYRDANVVWVLSGDRQPEDDEDRAIVDAMAAGIREVVGDSQLITSHPQGGYSSSSEFNDRDWLDFNFFQSGHSYRDEPNYLRTQSDRALTPVRPVFDGEPCYEDHPVNWNAESQGWFSDFDTRRAGWWSMLAGAAGHTYGHHAVWQMWQPGRDPISVVRTPWQEALDYPGAFQAGVMRRIFESVAWQQLVPAQEALRNPPKNSAAKVMAAVDSSGEFAMAYSPFGEAFQFDVGRLKAGEISAQWIDPRTGHRIDLRSFERPEKHHLFDPPADPQRGNDWVLLLRLNGEK